MPERMFFAALASPFPSSSKAAVKSCARGKLWIFARVDSSGEVDPLSLEPGVPRGGTDGVSTGVGSSSRTSSAVTGRKYYVGNDSRAGHLFAANNVDSHRRS